MQNHSNIQIRTLTKDDIPSLIKLYIQLDAAAVTLTQEKSSEVWKNHIEKNPYIKYFGAVEGEKVVATCYCQIIPNLTHNGSSICFVENVVTDKNYRKMGLGRKIIEMAEEFAKQNDCYKIILQSNVKRKEAHQFYEKLGFKSDTKKAFDLRLE